MRYSLKIKCDNDAFAGGNMGAEIARILRQQAYLIDGVQVPLIGVTVIRDLNGQRVGHATMTDVANSPVCLLVG